ncbi:MAG: transposase family protein, partial [Alphaproteobacteria bacterium]|nr:transposase family protein [Alphaproteobacteria bacterium]
NFGKLKLSFLKKFYPFKNATPSDDTFRRFFSKINPDQFKEIFAKWVLSLSQAAQAKVIAIDGKASRHTILPPNV